MLLVLFFFVVFALLQAAVSGDFSDLAEFCVLLSAFGPFLAHFVFAVVVALFIW